MHEILFSIGPFKMYSYGCMIAIGIISAYVFAEKLERKYYTSNNHMLNICIWGLLGGFLGAKLLFWCTELDEIVNNPRYMLDTLKSGFVVYGGIIGGIVSAIFYCKEYGVSFLKYFDLAMPAVALAQGFGRIGCFLAGCCYGRETTMPIGVVFTNSNFAPNGVRLIPTQIIFSIADFINFIILYTCLNKKKWDGQIGGLYLIFYSIGRFFLEYLRADYRGTIAFLSTSQFISILLFMIGIVLEYVTRKRRKEVNYE